VIKLLSRLWPGGARTTAIAPPETERWVYAIGDVHGRADLLIALLEQILADSARHEGRPELVFLGDYVDRGEGARDTLDLLIAVSDWPEIDPVFLMGNHEQMLLRFLQDPVRAAPWLRYGGLQTLMSYGVPVHETETPEALTEIRDRLGDAMGPHIEFIEALRLYHRSGNVVFVHAGADPDRPPEEQDIPSLLWGHKAFFTKPRRDGLWVVHGHTVVNAPEMHAGRIALDTGAYYTGRLSAIRFAEGDTEFFEA